MTTKIVDPITIGFILVALIATLGSVQDSQAGEVHVDVLGLSIPAGFVMVQKTNPPKFKCEAVPQPDTFEIIQKYKPAPKGLSKAGALILQKLEEAQ